MYLRITYCPVIKMRTMKTNNPISELDDLNPPAEVTKLTIELSTIRAITISIIIIKILLLPILSINQGAPIQGGQNLLTISTMA
jgi:hypothetical protein